MVAFSSPFLFHKQTSALYSRVHNLLSKVAFIFGASNVIYLVDMILEAPTRNTEFKGKFGTLNIRTRSVGKTNVKQFPSFSSDRRTAQSRSAQQLLFLPRRCHRCSCPALAALPTCPALSNGGPGGVIFSENGVDWKSDKTRIEKFPPSFPLWQGRSEPWVFWH